MNKEKDVEFLGIPDEISDTSVDTKPSGVIKKLASPRVQVGLLTALLVVFFVNAIVLGWFGLTVNAKLAAVVEQSEPQEVDLLVVTPEDCSACGKMEALVKKVKAQNVEIGDERTVASTSDEATALIEKYALEKLPALIVLSKEDIKQNVVSGLDASANLVGDKILVWEQESAPYYDLSQKSTVGLIVATYITDKACTECYDVVAIQRNALAQFGAYIHEEVSLDISDPKAKELIDFYSITTVPTAIFSAEAGNYPALLKVWQSVGTIEPDGNFVFRQMSALGGLAYRDLSTGKIVGPTAKAN